MAHYRVSMDIGGTFTDVITFNQETKEYQAGKSSTTPEDLTLGVFDALTSVVPSAEDISFMVHGTTQGLNAFLTRRGERVLLLATEGAHEQLHIARGPRWSLYDLHYRKAEPLVPLTDIVSIGGRLTFEGEVLAPLDEEAVRRAAQRARDEGVRAVAVAYLFSFRYPEHELRTREILREELGEEVTISLSHEAAKEWREYERTSSATVEAYTGPVIRKYLTRLEDRLTDEGLGVPLHVMQSSGGILTVDSARERPLQTLLSGPVGGAMGGAALAEAVGRSHLICVDMGGTSFDVSLVVDGVPDTSPEASIDGLPMLMPVVNIHTVGAGGGSIAWVEAGGLRVGPQSAGANPGPASYGRGGTEPTVTDANLTLGRVDPQWFAGGQMTLDVDAARAAIDGLASQFQLSTEGMAEGICDVANAKMAQAIRTITVARGIEPREFSLVTFGGAGPMHGAFLAQELGIKEVIVPRFPGAFSAWGMQQASVRTDRSEAFFHRDEDVDPAHMAGRLTELRGEVLAFLTTEGVTPEAVTTQFAVDVRYVAQEYTIVVPVESQDEPLQQDFMDHLAERFAYMHHERYGHANLGAPIELVTLRATGLGDIGNSGFAPLAHQDEDPARETVQVVFGGQPHDTTLVRRSRLNPGTHLASPAVILEETATTVVPPGFAVEVDQHGNIVLSSKEQ